MWTGEASVEVFEVKIPCSKQPAPYLISEVDTDGVAAYILSSS